MDPAWPVTIGKVSDVPTWPRQRAEHMVCSTLRSRGGTFLLGVEFSVQCGLCKRNGRAVETHYEGRGALRSKGKRIT